MDAFCLPRVRKINQDGVDCKRSIWAAVVQSCFQQLVIFTRVFTVFFEDVLRSIIPVIEGNIKFDCNLVLTSWLCTRFNILVVCFQCRSFTSKCIKGSSHYLGQLDDKQDFDVSSEGPCLEPDEGPSLETSKSCLLPNRPSSETILDTFPAIYQKSHGQFEAIVANRKRKSF